MSVHDDLIKFCNRANKLNKEIGHLLEHEGPGNLCGDLDEKTLSVCEKWANDLEETTNELAVLCENLDIHIKVEKAMKAVEKAIPYVN